MRKVILVHGAWHGSWCWSRVIEQLAARDVLSVAVDIEGHGLSSRYPTSWWSRPFDPEAFAAEPSGTAEIAASSAAKRLVEQIRTIGGGQPCVVVAHSLGGSVVTLAAELEPSLFANVVYVSAVAPVCGRPAAAYLRSPENAGETMSSLLKGNPMAIGATRIDPGNRDEHAAMRATFYGDVDEATATAVIGHLSPDTALGLGAEVYTVTPERYGAIPHTYVVCTQDNTIREPLQRLIIREIDALSDTATSVHELESSHSPFLSQPDALAAVIAGVS
jgi:pimeloyl-ACP methyl ester carboxylesterase